MPALGFFCAATAVGGGDAAACATAVFFAAATAMAFSLVFSAAVATADLIRRTLV